MMKVKQWAAMAAVLALATGAQAQLAGALFGQRLHGQAFGKVRSKHVIRATSVSGVHDQVNLEANALRKLAEMTRAQGFPRFGVTKSECTTMLVSGMPAANQCRIVAQMVAADEAARPDGGRPVTYHTPEEFLGS